MLVHTHWVIVGLQIGTNHTSQPATGWALLTHHLWSGKPATGWKVLKQCQSSTGDQLDLSTSHCVCDVHAGIAGVQHAPPQPHRAHSPRLGRQKLASAIAPRQQRGAPLIRQDAGQAICDGQMHTTQTHSFGSLRRAQQHSLSYSGPAKPRKKLEHKLDRGVLGWRDAKLCAMQCCVVACMYSSAPGKRSLSTGGSGQQADSSARGIQRPACSHIPKVSLMSKVPIT